MMKSQHKLKVSIVFLFVLTISIVVDVYAADGFGGSATGGAGGATVTVSNFTNFKYYATSTNPYIIRVSSTIEFGYGVKVQPKPNKTIEGVDHNATIVGNIDLSGSQSCHNIIIRNLTITNPYRNPDTNEGADGLTVWGATNIYITHCNIYDCGDGAIDMNNGTDYVTISWCRFYYPSMNTHRFCHIADQAHITFHHNWYDYGCDQRMPASTGGTIHMYNNYFSCTGNYYCSNARADTQILSEYNYYDHVRNPIYVEPNTNGMIRTVGNIYDNCTDKIDDGNDTVFTPPYTYTPDDAEEVPAIVISGAGNRLYSDFDGDFDIDMEDMYWFAGFWLTNSRPAFYQDLNDDETVSLYEFSRLAENWQLLY